jgi:hypothetical protein
MKRMQMRILIVFILSWIFFCCFGRLALATIGDLLFTRADAVLFVT